MTVHLRSVRYGTPTVSDHANLDDAVYHAYWQVEDNTAAPVEVTDDSGRVVLTHDALDAAMLRRGAAIEAAYGATIADAYEARKDHQ